MLLLFQFLVYLKDYKPRNSNNNSQRQDYDVSCKTNWEDNRDGHKEEQTEAALSLVSKLSWVAFKAKKRECNRTGEGQNDRSYSQNSYQNQEPSQAKPCESQEGISRISSTELLTSASKRIENLVMISGIGVSTYPAKLELAVIASHVIATLTLLYISLAEGTHAYFLIFNPFFELYIQLTVTRWKKATVIDSAALKANVMSAFARQFDLV